LSADFLTCPPSRAQARRAESLKKSDFLSLRIGKLIKTDKPGFTDYLLQQKLTVNSSFNSPKANFWVFVFLCGFSLLASAVKSLAFAANFF